MNRRLRLAVVPLALAAATAACGTPQPPQPPKAAAPAAPPGQQTGLVPQVPALPEPVTSTYDPKGRRDPFVVVERGEGPAGQSVASARLTGIVRGQNILALVETQDGIGYILRTGDTLFDGRVVEIGSDSIVFAVTAKPGSATPNRVVLRLAAN
jgi:Tfp pilus assembly protein PilP